MGGGGSRNLMLSSNLLKSTIPICGGEGGILQNLMLSSNLLKSKIPICGGGVEGGGGGLVEFDVEFKFTKIQNSHLCVWGVGWGGSQNLMLSSNLLKSKIPICGGGGVWNQFSQLLMLSPNLLKKKKFLSFQVKGAWEWFWIFNTEWFAIRSIANHKKLTSS